jgi:hypothetical protein
MDTLAWIHSTRRGAPGTALAGRMAVLRRVTRSAKMVAKTMPPMVHVAPVSVKKARASR